jgi:hypothetical protein
MTDQDRSRVDHEAAEAELAASVADLVERAQEAIEKGGSLSFFLRGLSRSETSDLAGFALVQGLRRWDAVQLPPKVPLPAGSESVEIRVK